MVLIIEDDRMAIDRKATIDELIERDGLRCMYPISATQFCDQPFVDNEDSRWAMTIDHKYPQARARAEGWSFEEIWGTDNLQLMHKTCNARKSDLLYLEDGTLPEKYRDKTIKVPRPNLCDLCSNGRLLFPDELCPVCERGPQPSKYPRTMQSSPKDCKHGWGHPLEHCWWCLVEDPTLRRPAIESVLNTDKLGENDES